MQSRNMEWSGSQPSTPTSTGCCRRRPRERVTTSWPRRALGVACAAIALTAGATAFGSAGAAARPRAAYDPLGTITPGMISVAVEPYMPYTGMKNGKLIGMDSEIFDYIARQLHQRIRVVVTNFAGMLSDVQTRRVDVSIGGIAWSASRAKVGLFTDPPYYSPVALAERKGEDITTVGQMSGNSIGTITGYIFVKALQSLPGVTMRLYQDTATAYQDLADGRVNALVIDTLLNAYEATTNPSLHLVNRYLVLPTPAQLKAHPGLVEFEPYMTGFYVPKQEPKLVAAMDTVIRRMYANGVMAKILTRWGANPQKFLKPYPGMAQQRHAVDRPKSWTPPSIR